MWTVLSIFILIGYPIAHSRCKSPGLDFCVDKQTYFHEDTELDEQARETDEQTQRAPIKMKLASPKEQQNKTKDEIATGQLMKATKGSKDGRKGDKKVHKSKQDTNSTAGKTEDITSLMAKATVEDDEVMREDHATQNQYLTEMAVNTDNEITSLNADEESSQQGYAGADDRDNFFSFASGDDPTFETEGLFMKVKRAAVMPSYEEERSTKVKRADVIENSEDKGLSTKDKRAAVMQVGLTKFKREAVMQKGRTEDKKAAVMQNSEHMEGLFTKDKRAAKLRSLENETLPTKVKRSAVVKSSKDTKGLFTTERREAVMPSSEEEELSTKDKRATVIHSYQHTKVLFPRDKREASMQERLTNDKRAAVIQNSEDTERKVINIKRSAVMQSSKDEELSTKVKQKAVIQSSKDTEAVKQDSEKTKGVLTKVKRAAPMQAKLKVKQAADMQKSETEGRVNKVKRGAKIQSSEESDSDESDDYDI